jgi:hypothetical protein
MKYNEKLFSYGKFQYNSIKITVKAKEKARMHCKFVTAAADPPDVCSPHSLKSL